MCFGASVLLRKASALKRIDVRYGPQNANTDRIEIERYFSTAKRRNGMGRIARKREDTSLSTIAMSVLVTNIFGTFKLAVEEFENEKLKSSKV